MSQKLTVELSDEVHDMIQRQAADAGLSPSQVASASLEQLFHETSSTRQEIPGRSEAELQAARERFERHLGAVDLGHATGANNEQIDADLEREYANTHEKA